MSDEDYKDMVIEHDKHLESLATSIESLAGGVGATNRKLEDIIDVISTQNVLIEKFTNLETNLKESFNRVHNKIRVVEDKQNSNGCPVLNIEAEKIRVANKRIGDLEEEVKKIISPMLIKSIATLLIIQSILFGTYLVQSIHSLDTKESTASAEYKALESRVRRCENNTNRNYGHITGRNVYKKNER